MGTLGGLSLLIVWRMATVPPLIREKMGRLSGFKVPYQRRDKIITVEAAGVEPTSYPANKGLHG